MGLPKGANVGRTYGVGKKVKLQVAQVDARKKRISLTIEGKTLEGSKCDYQTFLKQSKKATGIGRPRRRAAAHPDRTPTDRRTPEASAPLRSRRAPAAGAQPHRELVVLAFSAL